MVHWARISTSSKLAAIPSRRGEWRNPWLIRLSPSAASSRKYPAPTPNNAACKPRLPPASPVADFSKAWAWRAIAPPRHGLFNAPRATRLTGPCHARYKKSAGINFPRSFFCATTADYDPFRDPAARGSGRGAKAPHGRVAARPGEAAPVRGPRSDSGQPAFARPASARRQLAAGLHGPPQPHRVAALADARGLVPAPPCPADDGHWRSAVALPPARAPCSPPARLCG